MDDAVKKAFMDTMNEQFVQEFGFDLKTMMLFADAISRVKTSREKQLEAELEQAKKDQYDAVRDRMMAEQKYNELYKRAEKAEKERDAAVETLHHLANEAGTCTGCKRLEKECSEVYICECDGEDHWEWEGLNG